MNIRKSYLSQLGQIYNKANEGRKRHILRLLTTLLIFLLLLTPLDPSIQLIIGWLSPFLFINTFVFFAIDDTEVGKHEKHPFEKYPLIFFLMRIVAVPTVVIIVVLFMGISVIVVYPAVFVMYLLKLLINPKPFFSRMWVKLKPHFVRFILWAILSLSTVEIKFYRDRIVKEVMQILYDYEAKLPTRKPIARTDLTITFPKDDTSTAILEGVKKSNAALADNELQETETIITEFFDMCIYPKNQAGDVMPNYFTRNGVILRIDKCEDAGLNLRIYVKAARENNSLLYKVLVKIAEVMKIEAPDADAGNKAAASPKDDEL